MKKFLFGVKAGLSDPQNQRAKVAPMVYRLYCLWLWDKKGEGDTTNGAG
jgi:hypothetical protein